MSVIITATLLQADPVTGTSVGVLAQYGAIGIFALFLILVVVAIGKWFLTKYLPTITKTFEDGFSKLNTTIEKAERERAADQKRAEDASSARWDAAIKQIDRIKLSVDGLVPVVAGLEVRIGVGEDNDKRRDKEMERVWEAIEKMRSSIEKK